MNDNRTLGERIADFKATHPNFFMVAADHLFRCKCPCCVCFLADGLDSLEEPLPAWTELRDTIVPDSEEIPPLVIDTLMTLAWVNL